MPPDPASRGGKARKRSYSDDEQISLAEEIAVLICLLLTVGMTKAVAGPSGVPDVPKAEENEFWETDDA